MGYKIHHNLLHIRQRIYLEWKTDWVMDVCNCASKTEALTLAAFISPNRNVC